MDDLVLSISWQSKQNETSELFILRKELQFKTWYNTIKRRGNLYMMKFGEKDVRPMWEDQINISELVNLIKSPALVPFDCPLCQPYDYFDVQEGQYVQRRYLTKIVHPKYPEGFIDKEGVWAKCPCILKGEERKYLKFKGMRI